jgi:hypothetical protein
MALRFFGKFVHPCNTVHHSKVLIFPAKFVYFVFQIMTLNNTGLSIAVDWVGRYIYWSEIDDKMPGSTLYRMDLNQAERGLITISKILRRSKLIHSIDVTPFGRLECCSCYLCC